MTTDVDPQRTFENVKRFWQNEAAVKGKTPQVTIRDHFFRLHELQTQMSLIPFGSRVLDIGCGTGFSSLILSSKADVTAVDYSDHMIEWAKRILNDERYRNELLEEFGYQFRWVRPGKLAFNVHDLLTPLKGKFGFDIITGQRILTNIVTFEDQLQVLRLLRQASEEDTKLILVEPTLNGHAFTNDVRARFGLPPLQKYWRNCLIDESKFEQWEKTGWRVESVLTFDTYMLLSKIVYPAAYGQENCKFISGANKAAMETANLFRTKRASDELGLRRLLRFYLSKLKAYDSGEHSAVSKWADRNLEHLETLEWNGLGHQKLFLCATAPSN